MFIWRGLEDCSGRLVESVKRIVIVSAYSDDRLDLCAMIFSHTSR
jgi:hypothetical protein